MYEGKNIHYSSFDKKPLCSFSSKVCNQHRLNGYAFCVRHILEDPTAPFRRCSYVAKSSKQTCTQAIPKHEDREFCNNHMQVLGMIPRKEKKLKKDKNVENIPTDVKIPFQDRVKSRFNINKLQNNIAAHSNLADDPDDPYAFPDPTGDTKIVTTIVQPSTPSSAGDSPSANHVFAKSPGDSCSSGSSIAKFYPELAEKLEKIKPKNDMLKLIKDKGKDKSSRTMNSLQTRIAQNRIKSKRRGTQESSSQSQSPLHSFGKSPLHSGSLNDIYAGFGNNIDTERPQKTPPAYNNHYDASPTEPQKSAIVPGIELKRPPPTYFRQPFERSAGVTSISSPAVPVEEKTVSNPITTQSLHTTQPVNHSVPMEIPHGTPLQSLPGMPRMPIPNAFNLDLPNITAYLSAVQAKNPYLSGIPPQLLAQMNLQPNSVPFINLNSPSSTGNLNQNIVDKNIVTSHPASVNTSRPLPPPPPLLSPSGITNIFPAVCGGQSTTPSVTFTAATQQPINRPPPPSYSSAVAQTLNKPPVATMPVAATTKPTKAVVNVVPTVTVSLMSAKPSKLKHVLSESEVDKKIKTKMAKQYYNAYLKRKIYDHSLLKAGIDSCSDDSSDEEKNNLLPWQPHWFSASSDEEGMDEEEDQNDVIRTTKLALLRARLRRHCSQSRKAMKGNVGHLSSCRSSTQSLIDAARESVIPTVSAINERLHVQEQKVYWYKRRGLDRRQCLYKNDEEVQCSNPVVPCANHCLKHIMYNIDQQLFDYCTAKTEDNVQCCIPVIDITHELPLCLKHAREVEQSYKVEEEEVKPKRQRKKTKPSALTKPPKKGKKKKNQRKAAALQMTVEETIVPDTAESHMEADMEQSASGSEDSDEGEGSKEVKVESSQPVIPDKKPSPPPPKRDLSIPPRPTPVPHPPKVEQQKDLDKNLLVELPDSVLAANLPPDLNLNKGLELPLEQASRLLEEQDFQDVLNKIPDETFDMFSGKNGEPTKEEMDELERHLAAANMDLNFAQQSISSTTDYDEQIRILASILTNQSPGLPAPGGHDLLNGAMNEQIQDGSAITNNQSTSASPSSGGSNYQLNPVPQYHHNNQVSPLHHSTLMNYMANSVGQTHKINTVQQVGSPGSVRSQQMSPVNNLQHIRNLHHGSPVGQIQHHGGLANQIPHHGSPANQIQQHGSPANQMQHHGSPVNQVQHVGSPVHQVQHHGSPVSHVQGQIQNLQSPNTPGSPVPPQINSPVPSQTNLGQNIHSSGQMMKSGNNLPTTSAQIIGDTSMLIRNSHVLQTSGHQMYSVPNALHTVRANNLQTTMVQQGGQTSVPFTMAQQTRLSNGPSTMVQQIIPSSSIKQTGLPNGPSAMVESIRHQNIPSIVAQQAGLSNGPSNILQQIRQPNMTSSVTQHIRPSNSSSTMVQQIRHQNISSSQQIKHPNISTTSVHSTVHQNGPTMAQHGHVNIPSAMIQQVGSSTDLSAMVQQVGQQILQANLQQQLTAGLNAGIPLNILQSKLNATIQQQALQGKITLSSTHQTNVISSPSVQSTISSYQNYHLPNKSNSEVLTTFPQTKVLTSVNNMTTFPQTKVLTSVNNMTTFPQTKVLTSVNNMTSVPWQASPDGLPVYQNGFPSNSAQFVSDVSASKYVMTSAQGLQNCTDSQLLQSLVTTPENQVTFDRTQRVQLSAQTGTGS